MSGVPGFPRVSFDDENTVFLESVVIPSFSPVLGFESDEFRRTAWMKAKAEKYLGPMATEMLERFSTITSLTMAEENLTKMVQDKKDYWRQRIIYEKCRQRQLSARPVTWEELTILVRNSLDPFVLRNRTPPNWTPTSVSRDAVKNLPRSSKFAFAPRVDLPEVLNPNQVATLRGLRSEKEVVEFMTPHFERIFLDMGLVVINSENIPWLVEDNGNEKEPDLYLVPVWAYTKRTSNSKDSPLDSSRRFGTVDDEHLNDLVRILNCKMSIGDCARGETIMHMQLLTCKQAGTGLVTNGAIFGKECIELLEVNGNALTRMEEVNWSSGGSIACIREVIQSRASPWFSVPQLLHRLHTCHLFVIADPHLIPELQCSLLGEGSLGRVIRLATEDNEGRQTLTNHAMKVALESSINRLSNERLRLKKHADECGCDCLVQPCSELLVSDSLCGFIMTPVGSGPVTPDQLKEDRTLFDLVGSMLYRLHAHTPPIIHGDPRIHNLIYKFPVAGEEELGGFFWIDLADSPGTDDQFELSFYLHNDVVDMLESMCIDVSVSYGVPEAIDRYAKNPSRETMSAVMALVAADFAIVHGI